MDTDTRTAEVAGPSVAETAGLDELVDAWLSVPEAADALGLTVPQVRGLLRSGQLVAVRRGEPPALSVPAAFVRDGAVVKKLGGTLSVLRDQRFSDVEAVRWLFTPDDSLPGTPVQALRENRGTEVRRRAQASGF